MFREVRKQYGDVEANVLGWTVKSICKLVEVDFAVLVSVDTHHHVVDLLAVQSRIVQYIIYQPITNRQTYTQSA